MLIRILVGDIILIVVFFAGVSICVAQEDGYEYIKPSVVFSDGLKAIGSQSTAIRPKEYIVDSSDDEHVAVYATKVKESLNEHQNKENQKASVIVQPQTFLQQSSSFEHSATSFSKSENTHQDFSQSSLKPGRCQYVPLEYKPPVIATTSKPQKNLGISEAASQVLSSNTENGIYVSGQYKPPVISTTLQTQSQQEYSQPPSSNIETGQYVSGEYKPPVIYLPCRHQSVSESKPLISLDNTTPGSISVIPNSKPLAATTLKPLVIGATINYQPLEPASISIPKSSQYQTLQHQNSLNENSQSYSTSSQYQTNESIPGPTVSNPGNKGPSYSSSSKPQAPIIKIQSNSGPTFSQYSLHVSSLKSLPALKISQTYKGSSTVNPNLSYLPPKADTDRPKLQPAPGDIGEGIYQKPTFNSFRETSVTKYTNTPTTLRPLTETSKPEAAINGFGQLEYQSATKYTSTPTTVKPIVVTLKTQDTISGVQKSTYQEPLQTVIGTPKPQVTFGDLSQSTYEKPPNNAFKTFEQQTVTKYTNTPTTAPAFTVTIKPQPLVSGSGQSGYQKPYFTDLEQQSALKYTSSPISTKSLVAAPNPHVTFNGLPESVYAQQSVTRYTSTPTTTTPLTVTSQPHTSLSEAAAVAASQKQFVEGLNAAIRLASTSTTPSETIYQRPTSVSVTVGPQVSTVTFKPHLSLNGYGESDYQAPESILRYTSTPTTAKPIDITSSSQAFYQKPAVNAFGQKSILKYTSSPTTVKPAIATPKPRVTFSGLPESAYEKPEVSSFKSYDQQSVTRYSNTPTTATPPTVTFQPQPVLSEAAAVAAYQKQFVEGLNAAIRIASTATTPSETIYQKPTSGPQALKTLTPRPTLTTGSLVYLPPKGDSVPVNAASSSGAVPQSFFEFASTTTSRAVDEVPKKKVEQIELDDQGHIKKTHCRTKRDLVDHQTDPSRQIRYLTDQGQFGVVQPNFPYQQFVQHQIADPFPFAQGPNSYGTQYRYISSVGDQQHHPSPQMYETAASFTHTVNTQVTDDSPVQDPQPLNWEELKVRQILERPVNDFRNLQPGSHVGPHVNKNSDQEYNVFDYDQYSKFPEDADVDA